MDLLFINQQYGNCFHSDYHILFIHAGIKEEIRAGRIAGIAELFIRGA